MFEFNLQQREFLERFGSTGNGKEMIALLKSIATKVDKTSSIPANSNYGAQVEGRKLMSEMIEKLLRGMDKKIVSHRGENIGVDEFD